MSESMAYVAYCKCGDLLFACVDNPTHRADTAKEVARIISQGYEIDRISCDKVRAAKWCQNRGRCSGPVSCSDVISDKAIEGVRRIREEDAREEEGLG